MRRQLTLSALFVTLLAGHATPALAVPVPEEEINVDVRVHVIPTDGQQQQQPPPQRPPYQPPQRPRRDFEPRVYVQLGAFADGLNLGALNGRFARPEVTALEQVQMPSIDAHRVVSGFTYGVSLRPIEWLRLPDLRFSFAGGPANTGVIDRGEFEITPNRLRVVRIDAGFGPEVRVGDVVFFGTVRAGLGVYFHRVAVSDQRPGGLGQLGQERVRAVAFDLVAEAGADIYLGDNAALTVAYRHGILGPVTHGATIALRIETDD